MTKQLSIGVVGSRNFDDYNAVESYLDSFIHIHSDKDICIVSGGANGADALAERYASEKGLKFLCFPADWNKYGKIAGFIRNAEIVTNSDRIVAFWDGKSSGTKDTIDKAERAGIISYVFVPEVRRKTESKKT